MEQIGCLNYAAQYLRGLHISHDYLVMQALVLTPHGPVQSNPSGLAQSGSVLHMQI